MYFEQFYLACLSHASYLVASEGIAAVVDPQRDVNIYLEEAAKHGFSIKHVVETHLHADFVSGHQELARRTGARIYLGAKAGAKFQHVPIQDGDELTFGQCRLEFLETPGHTVESVSVVVTDLEKPDRPLAVLTGDTLFIGDVGRPDLSADMTPQQLAGLLYDSLHQKLLRLPDDVLVYPAHGAGSLCGRQMSSEKSSTIGREKATNYALRATTRADFVKLLTAELPERPGYFALDVEINRSGAPPLEELPHINGMPSLEIKALQDIGAIILDTRPAADFAAAHVPGSVQIGLAGQFASWAAIVLGLNKEIVVVAEDDQKARESRVRLARVGIENVIGYLEDGIAGWSRAGLPVEQTSQVSVEQLHGMLLEDPDSVQVIDVRRASEWDGGHVQHALHKPLDHLATALSDLEKSKPTAVYCKSGYRSTIATSLLERAGFEGVMNVTGGFDAWAACKLPFIAGEPAVAGT
jgi:hydroxyacylglutathione hydrolase